MKATRKAAKGGLPNAMFVQAAVESLPEELDGIANQIHINFPWGSLLRALANGDAEVLSELKRISAPGCVLEIVIGLDQARDRSEIERLGISELTPELLSSSLIPKYRAAGFDLLNASQLDPLSWSKLETTWARRLSGRESRTVFCLRFSAI